MASRHIGSERSAREGERRNRGNEKLCHVIPPSPAVKNKCSDPRQFRTKRPHTQSDAASAESALLTTEHIAYAKKPIEAAMETPITNVAMNMVRPPTKKTAERYSFSEFKEVILW